MPFFKWNDPNFPESSIYIKYRKFSLADIVIKLYAYIFINLNFQPFEIEDMFRQKCISVNKYYLCKRIHSQMWRKTPVENTHILGTFETFGRNRKSWHGNWTEWRWCRTHGSVKSSCAAKTLMDEVTITASFRASIINTLHCRGQIWWILLWVIGIK